VKLAAVNGTASFIDYEFLIIIKTEAVSTNGSEADY